MEDRRINDSQITASSRYSSYREPREGRLNNQLSSGSLGSWCPNPPYKNEWIQVDLQNETIITKVATQGRPSYSDNEWVTKYSISFSMDNIMWTEGDCVKVRFSPCVYSHLSGRQGWG